MQQDNEKICLYLFEEYSTVPKRRAAGETSLLVLNIIPKALMETGIADSDLVGGKNIWIKEESKKVYETSGSLRFVLPNLWGFIKEVPSNDEINWIEEGFYRKHYKPSARPELERKIEEYLASRTSS